MKNLNERSEFERQWEDVFKEAELSPSEGVWDRIDSALSREEAGYFRKRAFYFKLLAAASIAFALGVSIFSINYYLDRDSNQQVVVDNNNNNEQIRKGINSEESINSANLSEDKNEAPGEDQISGRDNEIHLIKTPPQTVNSELKSQEDRSNILTSGDSESITVPISNGEQNLSREFYSLDEIDSKGINQDVNSDLVYEIDHIYLIPIMPRKTPKQKNVNEGSQFLASLDFSTGLFNPNFQQGGNVLASSPNSLYASTRVESVNDQLVSFNTSNKDFLLVRSAGQETKPDISYSYGANVGFKVSKRIVLQTGIAYRKANTTTTTTGFIEDAQSNTRIPIVASYQYQLNGLSSVNRIEETDLKNQYEFASIPIRAGYVVLDNKFNITLLAGVSSEFFLNNQISDNNNYLETLNSSSSAGSPYKNVYFNGSLGTMLGYSFAPNYLISVEPSYRFAMNSFTKDDFYLSSLPQSFMVTFGVTYNFK